MEFLRCLPSVFVIGNEYEILVTAKENGLFSVTVDGKVFYEENAGCLPSEKSHAKIRVPQAVLDKAKKYTIRYRKTIDRKAYYSKLGDMQAQEFAFKPIEKEENIHIYHVADVHYRFDLAKKTVGFFGDDTDLFVVNGDIGEVETEENYFEVCQFVGDISGGKIPVVFVRGNHDTRGKLAEKFTDYFPCEGKNTYYEFEVGNLKGIALDCGEDKYDNHLEYGAMEYFHADSPEVYGGVNAFEKFRRKETEFLKGLEKSEKLTFAVSHICPAQTAQTPDSPFAIEKEVYTEWNKELARLNVAFMLAGHMHKAYVLEKNDKRSLLPHEYYAIVGSACFGDDEFWGAGITVNKDKILVQLTDSKKQVCESFKLLLHA